MFWFAIPVAAAVVYAGKKVYDAVSEDSSSSSSTSYSDNSAQREREAKAKQAQQDREKRQARLTKQLMSTTQAELDKVSQQYLREPLTLDTSQINAINAFTQFKVNSVSEAKAALSLLSTGPLNLKPVSNKKEYKKLEAQVEGLEQLEKQLLEH